MIIRGEALKACLVATDPHETKYNLDAVQLQPDGRVVATDGHLLLVAKETEPFKDEDFPSKDVQAFTGSPKIPVVVPKAIVQKLLAAMPKGAPIPILGAIQVGMNGKRPYAVATDLETPLVAKLPDPKDARFPEHWPKVLPKKGGPHVTVIFTGKMLQQIARAAAAIGNARTGGYVRMEIPLPGQEGPAKHEPIMDAVRIVLPGDEVEIEGAAMPCRI